MIGMQKHLLILRNVGFFVFLWRLISDVGLMKRIFRLVTGRRDGLRRLLPTVFILLCLAPKAFSQSVNALFLKDGSKVTGYVQAMDPAGDVKIRTNDGKILSFPVSDIGNIIWSYREKEPSPGPIYRYGEVFRWKYNDMELSDRNFDRYFDDDLYYTYMGAKNQFNLGGAGLTLGIGCTLLSILYFDPDAERQSNTFYAYAYGANVLICLGCVFSGIGISRLNWVERTFNARQESYDTSFSRIMDSVKLNPSIMLTAHNDLAVGASVSFSF